MAPETQGTARATGLEGARRVGARRVGIERRDGEVEEDWVAEEAPLEIRVDGEPLAVTMRTPGDDVELAAGYLFTEGLIRGPQDLESLERSRDPLAHDPDNIVLACLSNSAADRQKRVARAQRERIAVSACGLCGKARLEDIYQSWPPVEPLGLDRQLAQTLPAAMEEAQRLFPLTGGIHAAALFDASGRFLALREDVGRHNAVDKLIGYSLLRDELPWRRRILVVSARAGFEIVQKALMAATPALVAVGAASSLAVDAARRGGLELFTFVRADRANRHVQ